MLFRRLHLLLLCLAVLAVRLPAAQEDGTWIFEGLITKSDPALAPDLQSGWVLSGSFVLVPLDMEEEPVEAGLRAGRLSGGISAAELTVDLYRQLQFEAVQVPGMAGVDYQDDNPDQQGRDLLGWFFPVRGRLKETGWTSRWLQVWLADPDGKMIRTVPPRIPPHGIEWRRGWFRLTFEDATGRTTFADGRIDLFAPLAHLEQEDPAKVWKGIAAELADELVERDTRIAALQEELDATRARLDGLQRMVDLLVQERSSLQEENSRLAEQARLADPAIASTLASLTADKSLLQEEMGSLSARNQRLAESLASAEGERLKLQARLEEIEARRALAEELDAAPANQTVPLYFNDAPVGTLTIVEDPVVIEKPVAPEGAGGTARPPVRTILVEPGSAAGKSTEWRRMGPRKFR